MSIEQNKSIVRRWVETGWNALNVSVIDEVYSPNFVQHESSPTGVTSAEALKHYVAAYCSAFPDIHFSIDDLIAEGDKVVWRWTATATHLGNLLGIPPTGKSATVTGHVTFRLMDNKIVEAWLNLDLLEMMQQIGVIPVMSV